MIEKYNKLKKINNSMFHLGLYSLIISFVAIFINKWLYFTIFLSVSFICLIIYLLTRKKINEILTSFTKKCPLCDKDMSFEEDEQYMISKMKVDKATFDLALTSNTDKNLLKIKKYYCLECKICYSIIEIYGYKNNGEMYLSKTNKNLDTNYEKNY